MTSQGPIIRTLELLAALTGLAAIAGLVLSLVLWGGALDRIQASRAHSASDTCYLIRGQLLALTPPARRPRVSAYLSAPSNPLHDCDRYGRSVTRLERRRR